MLLGLEPESVHVIAKLLQRSQADAARSAGSRQRQRRRCRFASEEAGAGWIDRGQAKTATACRKHRQQNHCADAPSTGVGPGCSVQSVVGRRSHHRSVAMVDQGFWERLIDMGRVSFWTDFVHGTLPRRWG